jgi:hypothetical protein
LHHVLDSDAADDSDDDSDANVTLGCVSGAGPAGRRRPASLFDAADAGHVWRHGRSGRADRGDTASRTGGAGGGSPSLLALGARSCISGKPPKAHGRLHGRWRRLAGGPRRAGESAGTAWQRKVRGSRRGRRDGTDSDRLGVGRPAAPCPSRVRNEPSGRLAGRPTALRKRSYITFQCCDCSPSPASPTRTGLQ